MEKKHYIYLIKNRNYTLFKIGYTSNNPEKRFKNYISHNPEVVPIDYWEVPNKRFENYVRCEVLKLGFIYIDIKHQKEWMCGNLFKMEVDNIIKKLKEQHNVLQTNGLHNIVS